MNSVRLRTRLGAALLLTLACDPGYDLQATVTVPEAVAAGYSDMTRGLLLMRVDTDGYSTSTRGWGVVCGGPEIVWDVTDSGLGLLDGTRVTAWIDPLPAADTRPCGAFAGASVEDNALTIDAGEPKAEQQIADMGDGGCFGGDGTQTAMVALSVAP